MQIKRIKATNYKTYKDLDLDLSPLDDRSIILIGGLNGGGKTTLYDAIRCALYGFYDISEKHEISAKEFRELLNQGTAQDDSSQIMLELTFTGMVLGKEKTYILRRTYMLNPAGRVVESVKLNLDGTIITYGSATPEKDKYQMRQQVDKIIKANLPLELSKYFLFDAMRAGQLLDGGNLINVIRENINNVMGFNKYDQISQAARKVQEDYTKERLDNEQMQKEYSGLVENRQKLIDENQALDIHLKKLREFAVVHLDDYQKAKTGKQTEDNLQQKIRTTEEKIETVNAGAQNFLERVAKLHQELETDIFVPHLASLQKAALNIVLRSKQELENRKKNHLDENKIREVVYAAFDEAAKADPNVKKLDKELIAAAVINRYTDVSSSDEYVFLDDEEVSALRNMYDRPTQNNFPDLDTERKRQNVEMESLPQLREQLDVFRRQLSGDDFAIISSYETNEAEIKNTETAIAQNDAEIKKLSNQIESYDIQIQQEPDLKYDTLVKLPDLFNRISKKLLEQKRHSIEQLMKDELNINLISHQGVIGRVELGNDMALKIFHQNGNEIFLSQLNAGAKQIVIQVLLKVLRKQGDYEPPIMIDTVMGVLDKESRDSVIENYFPSLGEQSILLSTNTEITPENDYPKLEAHIAKTYTLVRDKEKQLTNVVPGYFGRQLNQE